MIEVKNLKRENNKFIFDFIFEPTYGGDPIEDYGRIEYEYGSKDFTLIKACNRDYFGPDSLARYYSKIFNSIDQLVESNKDIPETFRIQWY